ncbi:hypothetical protein [Demequina soli]|uniref:hypothetical protein n=1 Tax=Demequina soli TaxID=1638987 RepID=UPI0012E09F60|nr:hypothetical protein [Demequina soli]
MTDVRKPRKSQDDGPLRAWGRAAGIGVIAEGIALAVAGLAYGIHALSLPEPAYAVGLGAFCVLSGAGLLLVGRALVRGARWGISAALTWQVLQTLAGLNLVGARAGFGIALAAAGVVVGVLVVVAGRPALRPAEG